MKIVHAIFSMCIGGAETLLVDIANGQAQSGKDEVHVVVVNNVEDRGLMAKISPKVHVHRIGRNEGSRNPWHIVKLNALLRKINPDILHLHHIALKKYILGYTGQVFFTAHSLRQHLPAGGRGVNVIAISDAVAEDLKQRHPRLENIRVIPNGIDLDIISRAPLERTSHKPFRIVEVGRLQYDIKGQDILLRALGCLVRRGITDVNVDFLGTNVLGTLPELEKIAEEEGVRGKVRFITDADRNYIYGHLQDYDLMCHTARFEGFGMAVAEGLTAGVPVAVTPDDGPYEVTDKGRFAAAIFRNNDPESCADAIEQVVAAYPKALESLKGAYEHIDSLYSLKEMTKKYREYYES